MLKRWMAYLIGPFSYRQGCLSSTRVAITEDEFVARIDKEGGDKEAARFVWNELINGWTNPGFTPYPEDDFLRVYGIADEELDDDLILKILLELGLPIPAKQDVLDFGPVSSPLRLAQFVSMCRALSPRVGP